MWRTKFVILLATLDQAAKQLAKPTIPADREDTNYCIPDPIEQSVADAEDTVDLPSRDALHARDLQDHQDLGNESSWWHTVVQTQNLEDCWLQWCYRYSLYPCGCLLDSDAATAIDCSGSNQL